MNNIIITASEARRQANLISSEKERRFKSIMQMIEKEIQEVMMEGESTVYVCLGELPPFRRLKDQEAKAELEEKIFESLKAHGYDYSWVKSVKEITISF
jgi:hypothetical protein